MRGLCRGEIRRKGVYGVRIGFDAFHIFRDELRLDSRQL